MRWAMFIAIAYLAVVLHTSVGALLRIPLGADLALRVDLLAALAVMVALRVRGGADALLAGWTLGLLEDLTTIGTPIGLYAVCFALGAGVVYQLREAVFSENPVTQFVLGLVFCLLAQGLAVLFTDLYVLDRANLGLDLLRALLVSICTAVFTPLLCRLLRRVGRAFIVQPAGRR